MAVSFGVTSTGGYGILQTVDKNSSAEVAEVRDETGKVVEMTAYSKTVEVDFEGVFDSDTIAEVGTELECADITGVITSISESESNTDFKKIKGKIQLKDAANITEYSAGTST